MPKKSAEDTIIQIEETQAALRDCIKRAKDLVDNSDRLLRRHKEEVIKAEPENPAQ